MQYKGITIRRCHEEQDEFVCLSDMWKAAEGNSTNAPHRWMRLLSIADLLLEFSKNSSESIHLLQIKPKSNQSSTIRNQWASKVKELAKSLGFIKTIRGKTFAIPDLAIAYAQDLSPEFHAWALTAIRERMEEESNPELAYKRGRERAIQGWEKQGKSNDWIQDRLNSIENYKGHTGILAAHGVKLNGFSQCADAINSQILGGKSKQIKSALGLSKKSDRLRDHLNRKQLTALSFAEAMADDEIEVNNAQGNNECMQVCSETAQRVVEAARKSTHIIVRPHS